MIKHLKTSRIQRSFIKKTELNILLLKNILFFHNKIHNKIILKYLLKELNATFQRLSSRSRLNNICVFTGRSRAVYHKIFKLTRMQIREKTNTGLITGIKKSSW